MDGKVGTAPPHWWGGRWGLLAVAASREETEFFAAPNGRPAAVHTELGVDALGVGPDRAQPHDQLVCDTGAIKVGGEKPQDIKLSFAERLHQALTTAERRSLRPKASSRRRTYSGVMPRLAAAPSMSAIGAPSATNVRT